MQTSQILAKIKKDKLFESWSVDEDTTLVLGQLIRSNSPKKILELGTFIGYGTIKMLSYAPKYTVIFTVDFMRLCWPYFNLLNKRDRNRVVFFNKNINYFFNSIEKDLFFDLIFIDADHAFKSITNDLGHALKHSYKSTIIVLHDANSNLFPGVKITVNMMIFFNFIFLNSLFEINLLNVRNRNSSTSGGIAIIKVKGMLFILKNFLSHLLIILSKIPLGSVPSLKDLNNKLENWLLSKN
jgi:predicted O-methyltransferase YrrM